MKSSSKLIKSIIYIWQRLHKKPIAPHGPAPILSSQLAAERLRALREPPTHTCNSPPLPQRMAVDGPAPKISNNLPIADITSNQRPTEETQNLLSDNPAITQRRYSASFRMKAH